jgi:hypothetical protein
VFLLHVSCNYDLGSFATSRATCNRYDGLNRSQSYVRFIFVPKEFEESWTNMHEAITIITCLTARVEEFCSVATFSDMKHSKCRSESCLPDCKADKEPHNCDARRSRRGTLSKIYTSWKFCIFSSRVGCILLRISFSVTGQMGFRLCRVIWGFFIFLLSQYRNVKIGPCTEP